MFILKKNDINNTPAPIKRLFRNPLCPHCRSKLSKIKANDSLGQDIGILDFHVLECMCGYQYAGGDLAYRENSVKSTYQYQIINVKTGKNFDDETCQKILDKINREGNAEVQRELAKLR